MYLLPEMLSGGAKMSDQDLAGIISNPNFYGQNYQNRGPQARPPLHHHFLFMSLIIAVAVFVVFFAFFGYSDGATQKLSNIEGDAPPPLPDDGYEPIFSDSSPNTNQPPALPGFN
jgi:hypothetical protein